MERLLRFRTILTLKKCLVQIHELSIKSPLQGEKPDYKINITMDSGWKRAKLLD